MTKKIGICFSKEFVGVVPLDHIVGKRPVYFRFLELLKKESFEPYVLTRKTYLGKGIFDGVWHYTANKFVQERQKIRIDLVYDRTGGVIFPPEHDLLKVVNIRQFKILCWDKWKTFAQIGQYMPKTFWVVKFSDHVQILDKIKDDWVVLKPYNGLKGLDIYIGPKSEAVKFTANPKKLYIAQEFIDTSGGVPGITGSLHDIRIVIISSQPVWSHVRVPPEGSFKANAAGGGILREIDYDSDVPEKIKEVVDLISQKFYREYDNPVYSLDFGIGKDGRPYIFEINDQIGFPRWEMKNRDNFLLALIENFKEKLG
jgi:glutathione synthase/RimK-type ligase-like ATP-grasp enzyme